MQGPTFVQLTVEDGFLVAINLNGTAFNAFLGLRLNALLERTI